jgi:6-phosphogluconolactonase (cycloisomerase 2 family)
VNSSSGALTGIPGSPFATASHPAAMTLSRAENFLYVANINLNSVSAFSVAADGSLQAVPNSPFPLAGSGPTAVATGASDHFLYAINQNSSNVSIMTINSTTGALSEILGSPFAVTGAGTSPAAGTGPNSVVLDSTGSFLYVTCTGTNNLFGFSVDANAGKLNALTNSPYTAGTNPSLSVIDPLGTTLFVINPGSNTISHFTINADGTLTSVTDTVSTPTGASSLAFTH